MYRLEYMANFPRSKYAWQTFLDSPYPITNPFNSQDSQHTQALQKRIAKFFNHTYVQFFGCTQEDFATLFLKLGVEYVSLSVGFSQASYQSFKWYKKIHKLIKITPETLTMPKVRYYFIPYMNEDILSLNALDKIITTLDSTQRDYVLFVEISSLLQVGAVEILQSLAHPKIAFVLNAERIGLFPRSGIIVHSIPELMPMLDSIMPAGFLESLDVVLSWIHTDNTMWEYCKKNYNALLFKYVKNLLGKQVGLFTPLEQCFGNCLALRLFGAKARVLAQSLLIEEIAVINGMDCLLGNFKPSFVLAEMGYEENECRELLSISFMHLEPTILPLIAQKIAQVYTLVRSLEI